MIQSIVEEQSQKNPEKTHSIDHVQLLNLKQCRIKLYGACKIRNCR